VRVAIRSRRVGRPPRDRRVLASTFDRTRTMSDADEAVLGKRARDDVPPAPVVEESDDEDIGPMPLPAGAGAKKKRKGASRRAG
jgi:hypothetical protein